MPSVYELASTLYPLGTERIGPKAMKDQQPVTYGMTAKPLGKLAPGIHEFSPEQLLSLSVPAVSLNGVVRGFQREFVASHCRKIARSMRDGEPMPDVYVTPDGEIIDGQHRTVAGVLAGVPVRAIVLDLDKDQRARLFANQRKAKPVDANTLIISGQSPYEKYIRKAVQTNGHPWHEIVSINRASKTKISPVSMLSLLVRYVGDAEANRLNPNVIARWDENRADEMAPLVACFGNRKTNPAAFTPVNLRAIGTAAMFVFRRNPAQPSDRDRWMTHMPTFPFGEVVFIRDHGRMADELLGHWNKRLSGGRRVYR